MEPRLCAFGIFAVGAFLYFEVIILKIAKDFKAIKLRDPAAGGFFTTLLLYNGFHAIAFYRLAHFFWKIKLRFIARLISSFAKFITAIDIHPGAEIEGGLFIDHGTGVVIGETAIIGKNCTLYQGVTLGGTGKDKGKRHPTLEDDVLVGAGAKILGPFTVGRGSKIAANAVLLQEIPPFSTAVGVPARVVKQAVFKGEDILDMVHIPDPVAQEICMLRVEIDKLKKKIKKLEGEKNEDI